MTLDELAIKHNTDKSHLTHDYCPIYEALFGSYRERIYGLLEIGIAEGASLKMWGEYLPTAIIYGIDKDPYDVEKNGDLGGYIQTYIADQSNPEQLKLVMESIDDAMDVIVDDGSHDPNHIITSLTTLFPYLKEGGFYCIEDLEHPRRELEEHLKGYNYWFSTSKSHILNSNLVIIRKS